MAIVGIRFCSVVEGDNAKAFADFLGDKGWGMMPRDMGGSPDAFQGAVFPVASTADGSWAEIWPAGEHMPAGTMLQIVVDDADRYAEQAKANGLEIHGPMDAHGERIYSAIAPGGMPVAVLSKL